MAIASAPSTDLPIWQCQTNPNPFDPNEPREWADYPHDISEAIEAAYQDGVNEIVIRTGYIIAFADSLQIHSTDQNRQRPIRRRTQRNSVPLPLVGSDGQQAIRREERYSSPLDSDSSAIDTHYHGSRFIINWLIHIAGRSSDVSFDQIYPLLMQGLKSEARQNPKGGLEASIDALREVQNKTSLRVNSKRMKALKHACIKLYTNSSCLYQITNQTLRDNDTSKIETLGPFCFLLYDFIGSQSTENHLIQRCLRQMIGQRKSTSLTVYRGDRASAKKLDEYRQAAGNMKRCFKWLCFVSTSTDEHEAVKFPGNVLYEIDLGRYKFNDQFADISALSTFSNEQEILLRPGVRFRIDRVGTYKGNSRTHIHIHVLPSYIFTI